MRLFIFESNVKTGLRAFVGDVAGRNLPDQFSPWRQIGAAASGNAPPYNISRDTIEKAINAHGFQLWRVKPKMARTRGLRLARLRKTLRLVQGIATLLRSKFLQLSCSNDQHLRDRIHATLGKQCSRRQLW
jgi:hypothetical protein